MKRITLYIATLLLIVAGCSSDSDTTGNSAELAGGDGAGGSMAVFALKGDYLYTVDHTNLNVFSLLNTTEPVKVNMVSIGFNIETLFSYGDYLYIGSQDGMFIYSLANPENPQQVSAVQHFTACDPVVANGTHAFVTLHSNTLCGSSVNQLEIYDTSNMQAPILVHTRTLTAPKGLGLYNNYLFVCDDEVKIFDVTNPAEPVLAGSINKQCFDVIIRGDDLYAIGESGLFRYQLDPNDITDILFKSQLNFQ